MSLIPLMAGIGTGGTGGSFTPADLPSIQHWYKATDLVLSDNDPVATWADKFGSKNLTAAGSVRPTYKANAGDPYVEFDGTDDVLANLTMAGGWNDTFGVVIVDILTTGVDFQRVVDMSSVILATMASGDMLFAVLGGGPSEPMPARPTGFMAVYYERDGALRKIRLNGSETTSADAPTATGTELRLGGSAAGEYKNMRLKEVILGSNNLSAGNFTSLAGYIFDTYGLTL